MDTQLENLYQDALELLGQLCRPQGIYASAIDSDNYKRVWSRDSLICGFAGILVDDDVVIDGMKRSLLTLAKHQHELGMIPSNALDTEDGADVSYGSLVGRVDANTWFILGACLYYLKTGDEETWEVLKPRIEKCRSYLLHIELNAKGWIYTPLSGNWADEYPTHGYTLYDNMLRIWGETLWNKIQGDSNQRMEEILAKTRTNFWPQRAGKAGIYLEQPYRETIGIKHFCTHILPGSYNSRFDAAGNALALINFELSDNEKEMITDFLFSLSGELGTTLIPAFWPVIHEGDDEWKQLQENYAYAFKNEPGYFHNGGVWPVWMGLFTLGLSCNGMRDIAKAIVKSFLQLTTRDDWEFQEYIDTRQFQLSGKKLMGFTASGIVFMYHALKDEGSMISDLR